MNLNTLPLLALVIGALVYAFAPPKAAELGRVTFSCAMLVLLASMVGHVLHL